MTDEFDQFWDRYPRKVSKGSARKAWLSTEKIRPALNEILYVLEKQSKSEQWQTEKFIPHAASWLRAERWTDTIVEDRPTKSDNSQGAQSATQNQSALMCGVPGCTNRWVINVPSYGGRKCHTHASGKPAPKHRYSEILMAWRCIDKQGEESARRAFGDEVCDLVLNNALDYKRLPADQVMQALNL